MGKGTGSGGRELHYLKDENTKLARDVPRKNKALAEVAALLTLRVKSPRPQE